MKICYNNIINKRISLWLILLLISIRGLGQYNNHNLVPNSSFEDSVICPSIGYDKLPAPWYRPINYYNQNGYYANSCSTDPNASVPSNRQGYQFAHTGQAYGLITTYSNFGKDYIQVKLKDSLKKNKDYYSNFFVVSPDKRVFGSNNISLLFTKAAIYPPDTLNDPNADILATAQIVGYGNPIITDTMNWTKISGIFKAQGGEQYITIGNFKTDAETDLKVIQPTSSQVCYCAGYFLDDVSVIPLDSFCLKADAGRDTTIKLGDSVFIGSYTNGIDSLLWLVNGTIPKDSTRPGFYVSPTTTTFYVLHQIVNGCYSSDTVTVNVTIVPLTITNYELRMTNVGGGSPPLEGLGVVNKWQTMNEVNVSHYNVQRSINGKDFITVGKVKANNKVLNEYRYTDDRLPLTVDGQLYYRIVGVDVDGKMTYSEVRTVDRRPLTIDGISVFPNPCRNYVSITSKGSIKEVKLLDYLGRTVFSSLYNNINNLSLNINNYPKGLYILQTTTLNKIENVKLVIE